MAKAARLTPFKTVVFLILGLLAVGFFWHLQKTQPTEEAQTQLHLPAASHATAVSSSGTNDDPSSPGAAAQKKTSPNAAPAPDKQEKRWMDGETVWSSAVEKNPSGGQHRVRLIQTSFYHQLLRVEEEVTPDPNGGGLQITQQRAMVATQLLIKAAPGVSQERLAAAIRPFGAAVMRQIPGSEMFLISIPAPDGAALPAAVKSISQLPGVVSYAEPDFIVHSTTTPNDTRFSEQWSLNNTGQTSGTVDADIDAPEAWALTTGSSSVIVAVIDSGVDYTHPDLSANIWTNPGETAGNGIDDDGNGYIDDTKGWNFLNGNNTPTDSQSHGTHVSGIIGAAGNNSAGISGVAWQVKLMPVKFLNSSGYGATSDAISGINYARVKGAHIINHSWGGMSFSQSLKDAIDTAGNAGILNVCAADNGNGTNEDVTPNYPSGFASASIIAVASTTETDALSNFSDYGPTTVHIGAPGSNILSTLPGGTYGLNSGTSMATPHVSGIAALVKAAKSSLTGADLKAILQASVDHDTALEGKLVTEGRANAFNALQTANDLGVLPATGVKSVGNRGGPFTPTSLAYTVKNYRSTSVNWTAALTSAPWATVSPASGTLSAGGTATVTVTVNTTLANAAVPGLQQGTLTITDTTTSYSLTRPVTLDVRLPYIYSYDLSTDPGWSRTGWWQYGTPTGRGGNSTNPNPDPTAGATGANVFGANLNGDFPTITPGTYSLTAGPFDLRGYTGTTVQFQRWLNTATSYWDGYHRLEISSNGGATWSKLWDTTYYGGMADTAWSLKSYGLGAQGDNQAAVLIRWSYDVSSGFPATSGWNIDDIQITGTPGKRLFIDGMASAVENGGSAALTLHIEPPSTTALTVTLSSSVTTAATLPATVTVPANTSSMSVTATLIDDALLDGTQTTVLTPSVSGYTTIPWNLAVTDNETATISLTVPSTATEGQSYLEGIITLSTAPGRDVMVALTSSNPYAAAVPAFAVVRSGQTRATFAITAPQNDVLDGTRSALITASVSGWTGASGSMSVQDDESSALTLSFPFSAGSSNYAEGVSTTGYDGTISLPSPRFVDTVVTLGLIPSGRMSLPATVTILAGKTSAAITPVVITDDALKNGSQVVTVTATASGVTSTSASVIVADNDISSLAFDLVPSPQVAGVAATVTLRALDVNGNVASGFSGTATITGLNNGVNDAAFTGFTATFANGVAAGLTAPMPTASTAYSLKAVSGSVTATSNSFVVGGALTGNVSLAAADIAYDAGTGRLYAATSGGTIVPINPATGAMDAAITVSATAVTKLRISATGSILYALVENATKLVRVDLSSKAVGAPFSFGNNGSGTLYTADDFVMLPNAADTVAVCVNTQNYASYRAVMLFVNGAAAAGTVSGQSLDSIPNVPFYLAAGSTSNRVYASGKGKFYQLTASAGGISLLKSYAMPEDLNVIEASGTRVVSQTGRIVDGETGMLAGRLSAQSAYYRPVALDSSAGRAAIITPTTDYGGQYELRVLETGGFSESARTALSQQPAALRLVRCGTKGFAYLSSSQVVLLTDPGIPNAAAPEPDLAIGQVAGPQLSVSGQPLSFSILVRNNGNAAASNVVLTSRWPAGAPFVAATTTQGTTTHTTELATFNLGTLAAGATATVTLTVTSPGGTPLNSVRITTTTSESNTLNNSSDLTVQNFTGSGYNVSKPMLNLAAVDMLSATAQNRLVASLGYKAGFFAGNLAFIDPAKSAVLAFVPVGSDPGPLALADDGTTAAAGLNSSGLIVPFNTSTLALGTAYAIGSSTDGRNLLATSMVPVPGQPARLAIARRDMTGATAGAALYQGSTQIGSATAAGVGDAGLAFGADATQLFGFNYNTLVRMNVSAAGLSVQATNTGVLVGNGIRYGNGVIVGLNGNIISPASLTITTNLQSGQLYTVCLDPTRKRIHTCGYNTLTSYDNASYAQTSAINPWTYPANGFNALVRWGSTGIAYLDGLSIYSYNNELNVFVPPATVSVVLPGSIAENAGTQSGAGSVQILETLTSDLVVSLQSSDAAQLQVPAGVTIPAGQLSATFNVSVTDDNFLNGARSISVVPGGGSGYTYQAGSTMVTDNETTTVSLSAPSTLSEGAGTLSNQVVVSLGSPAAADILIQTVSSDTTLITIPSSVVIPYGASSVAVPVTVLDDGYIRGTKNVTVTAAVSGWNTASKTIAITDLESATITLSYDSSSVSESSYYASGTVTLGGKVDSAVTVSLTSSAPSRMTVSSSVTIPAGSSSTYFTGYPVGNTITDGRQTVTTTGTAPGFTTGTATIVVLDDDPGAFTWTIPSSTTVGTLMNITATATTIDGDPATMSSGTSLNLAASRSGVSIPLAASTPLTNSYPNYSTATGTATITSAGAGTVLSVVYGGTTYASPPFTLLPGPQSSFVWGAINPTGPQPNVACAVTINAADSYGNPVSGFTGTASLSATQSASTKTIGAGTDTYVPLISTGYNLSRTQVVFLASEIGQAGSIRSLAVQMSQVPGRAYDAFTVRAKLTSRTTPDTSSGWDNTGWTTLKQGALDLGQAPGWAVIHLDSAFSYDGTSNLLLDFSFQNQASASGGLCYCTNAGTPMSVSASGSSGGSFGDPLTWTSGYNAPTANIYYSRPNVRFGFGGTLSLTPTTTGSFANGAWSGSVTFTAAASTVFLTAHSGTLYGDSNLFDVGAVPPTAPVLNALPAYASGTSASTSWSAVTAATDYYIEAATDSTFASPVASSGWITTTSYVFTGLADGTHYYYHVKARKSTLVSPWSNIADSTQDNTGPKIYLSTVDDTAITTFTTTRSPVLIQGHLTDTSGIASFAIISGGTSYPWGVNADGTWSVNLSTPGTGTYLLGFSGVDKASATANTTSRSIYITRAADTDNNGLPDDWQSTYGLTLSGANSGQTADFDHDGRANLLEYALNSPPNSSAGNSMPSITNEVKSADGKTYLVYRYDRRRGALDLTYGLEFSTDLTTWSATSQQTELTGTPTLNPDGVTERVSTRIFPDVSSMAGQKVFVRLKVTSSAP